MPAIFVLLLQVLFTLGAGWLLWKIWLRLSTSDPRAGTLIGAGLIIRALLAQAMFWISYLHLPIARSLQTGDGFWALAIDGRLYFENAASLLSQGWSAVALVNKTLPSPAFLQVLAVFQSLFGPVASVGALLNLFAYLGACAAILRLGRTAGGRVATPALIAIAAFSFAPAVIIWSVQPLKDPFFIFTIAAFVVACTLWQEAWRERFSAGRFFVPLLLMLTLLYLVVGIRWYFGVLLWVASVPYFAAAAWRSNRRVLAAVTNAAVFLALSQIIVFGALPYVPPQLLIHFGHDAQTSPRTIAETVVQSRKNFDTVHANTMIEAGTALRKVDTPIAEPPRRIVSRPPAPKRIRLLEKTASLPVKAVTPEVLPRATDSVPAPMSSVAQASEASQTAQAPRAEPSSAPAIESTQTSASTEAVRQQVDRDPTLAAATETSTPAPSHKKASQGSTSHKSRTREVKAVHETAPSNVIKIAPKGAAPRSAAPAPPRVAAVAPKPVFKPAAPTQVMPQSTFARLAAGLTAVVLPHFLGERMGLIHIGGGRGLWAIVETDTLFFDGLLLIVLYYVYRALPRGAWRNPSFWLVIISTAGVTVLLAYTISNFGTLFRHRGMIFIGLCLLLVVARDPRPAAGPLQEDLVAES
jgi:hypothetical protein